MNEHRSRRKGGRARRQEAQSTVGTIHRPALVRRIPCYDVVSEEGVEQIHQFAMRVIEEVGVEFRDEEALESWRKAGATVEGEKVRASREMVLELVGKVPSGYTQYARNPERTIKVGGDHMVFAPSYGPPFVRGLDGERRHGRLQDLNDLQKLTHMANAVHVAGGPIVEPTDIAVPHRHLHMTYSALKYSDKPIVGNVTAPSRAQDTLDMMKLVFGEDFVAENAVTTSIINSNSPLVWDSTMLAALRIYARHNQAVLISPFSMSGASMPASPIGAATLVTAEVLMAIAYSQMVKEGAPMVFGCPAMTVSLKTGGAVFGCPDSATLQLLAGMMARRYGLPHRGICNSASSKTADLYAGYDSIWGTFSAVLAGANWISHSGGNIEGTLTICFGKTILDYEQMDAFYHFASGADFEEMEEIYETIREVGPGGHFLGAAHTLKGRLFTHNLQNNVTFEQWEAEGRKEAVETGREEAARWLSLYEEPPMDPGLDEALLAFVRRREAEILETVE